MEHSPANLWPRADEKYQAPIQRPFQTRRGDFLSPAINLLRKTYYNNIVKYIDGIYRFF
jgi:hypothetical protein